MGRLGFMEIALIVGLALLLFGAGRIADIGKGLGEGIRNFKKGIKDDDDESSPKELTGDDPPKQIVATKDESAAKKEPAKEA